MKRRRFLSLLPAVPLAVATLPAAAAVSARRRAFWRGFWRGQRPAAGWATRDAALRSRAVAAATATPRAVTGRIHLVIDRAIARGTPLSEARPQLEEIVREAAR